MYYRGRGRSQIMYNRGRGGRFRRPPPLGTFFVCPKCTGTSYMVARWVAVSSFITILLQNIKNVWSSLFSHRLTFGEPSGNLWGTFEKPSAGAPRSPLGFWSKWFHEFLLILTILDETVWGKRAGGHELTGFSTKRFLFLYLFTIFTVLFIKKATAGICLLFF